MSSLVETDVAGRIPGPSTLIDFYNEASREFWPHESHPDREVTWWASSLGGCLQAQYAKARGEPETRLIDAQTRRTFAWGDQIERFIISIYQRLGLVADKQVYLYDPELRCSGKVDVVLAWPPSPLSEIPTELAEEWSPEWMAFLGHLRTSLLAVYDSTQVGPQRIGVEIKSAHSLAMKRMFTEGARENHKVQVGAYQLLDERLGLVGADAWRIDYIGKDSVGALSFGVGRPARDEAALRLRTLNSAWDSGADVAGVKCSCEGWMVEFCALSRRAEAPKGSIGFTCCSGASYVRKLKAAER